MRKAAVVLGGVIFSLVLFLAQAQAADKFGYIDLSRTFSEYNKAKTFEKALNDKIKVYDDERDKKVADFKSLQDKINLLNDKQREEKQGELQNKAKALQDYVRQKQEDLRKEEDAKTREVFKDIEDAVNKYSEKEGYALVFNSQVLVYKSKSMDITSQIIDILNKGK